MRRNERGLAVNRKVGRASRLPPSTKPSMCLALHCVRLSLSSPEGGEGRGEEAALPSEARTPPSPTLPPLVPRGERETFVERLNTYEAHGGLAFSLAPKRSLGRRDACATLSPPPFVK